MTFGQSSLYHHGPCILVLINARYLPIFGKAELGGPSLNTSLPEPSSSSTLSSWLEILSLSTTLYQIHLVSFEVHVRENIYIVSNLEIINIYSDLFIWLFSETKSCYEDFECQNFLITDTVISRILSLIFDSWYITF